MYLMSRIYFGQLIVILIACFENWWSTVILGPCIRGEFLKDIHAYIWLPWLLVLLQIYDEIKNFVQFG